QEVVRVLVAKISPPLLHQPFGVRPADRRLGGFHISEDFFDFVRFAKITAQDGINEAGLLYISRTLGLFHGFMDGGMRGNTVEPENLVETEPQEILECRALFSSRAGFSGD
ncbi:MAG: hypothetical protein WCS94_16205, partial [Verrucomicrobiota bacterium]